MTSVKRLAANRANAKKSTGPRTEAGKARSRLNSWKHGLTAKEITSEGESPRKFDAPSRRALGANFSRQLGWKACSLIA